MALLETRRGKENSAQILEARETLHKGDVVEMGLKKLKTLDLFSGIGGFSLGLERTGGFETVAFCEIDQFCRRVLAKHWPNVPCHDDITELSGEDVGEVDVICGGFPCQDISIAGKGAGIDGTRSGLWREYARLISELRPRYVIVENVSALLGRGIGRVLGDLAALGYDAEWHCIPASAVGAPHRRDRVWIIAYAGGKPGPFPVLTQKYVEESTNRNKRQWRENRQFPQVESICPEILQKWLDRSKVNGVDDGVSHWFYRLRQCGNSVVPQIAEIIGNAILDFKNGKTPRETNRPDA